jgi:hypothetical protein
VVETGTNDQGAHVTIQVRNPADHGADVAIIAQLAAIPEGGSDWISAVDLTPIRDPTQLRARWSTRVMTW